jgi:hypothetical protein
MERKPSSTSQKSGSDVRHDSCRLALLIYSVFGAQHDACRQWTHDAPPVRMAMDRLCAPRRIPWMERALALWSERRVMSHRSDCACRDLPVCAAVLSVIDSVVWRYVSCLAGGVDCRDSRTVRVYCFRPSFSCSIILYFRSIYEFASTRHEANYPNKNCKFGIINKLDEISSFTQAGTRAAAPPER